MPENPRNNQRLVLFLPDGARAGRVERVFPTGFEARLETSAREEIPRDLAVAFTMHLPQGPLTGEATRVWQDGTHCRLQFAALSAGEQRLVADIAEPE